MVVIILRIVVKRVDIERDIIERIVGDLFLRVQIRHDVIGESWSFGERSMKNCVFESIGNVDEGDINPLELVIRHCPSHTPFRAL